MMQGLKRWAAGGILLREIRGLRVEVAGLRQDLSQVLARLAVALEAVALQGQADEPAPEAEGVTTPGIEITYANDQVMQEFMAIELDLVQATGQPPTEGQILQEYERRHQGDGLPAAVEESPLDLLSHRARR